MISHVARGRRALLALPIAAALLAPVTPAQAEEVTPRPASGQLTFTGHGYGHGRGMSQWGAHGAATVYGLTAPQILDFYYPGTTRATIADETIRVYISADSDGDTMVSPAEGLTAAGAGGSVLLPVGSDYTRWRAVGTAPVALQYRTAAGAWKPFELPFKPGEYLSFTSTPGLVKVVLPSGVEEEVRGLVRATPTPNGLRTILHTPMETYLRGVVPNEMPASWHKEALSAQAVAARTYAAAYRDRQRANGSWYDICDTVSCQVFYGVATYSGSARTPREYPTSDAAIVASAGQVLKGANGALVSAEFGSSNGGYTVAGFVAKPDPYDGAIKNSSNSWKVTIDASDLDDAYGIGTFRSMAVLKRDGNGDLGGRVLSLRLNGDKSSATITGAQLRAYLGLKSDWFAAPSVDLSSRDWSGDGKADILARNPVGDLQLYAGNGAVLADPVKVGHGWGGMVDIFAAGNFDGVGGQDIIARHKDARLFFYGGDGQGSWLTEGEIGHGWSDYRSFISPGDWNADGRSDVLAIRTSTNELVLSTGAPGRVLNDPVLNGTRWGAITTLVAPGDFDGDGRADLIGVTTDGNLWLYSGTGTGAIKSQKQIASGWTGMQSIWSPGDFDGDGLSDVLTISTDGVLWLYPGTGSGFQAPKKLATGWKDLTPVR